MDSKTGNIFNHKLPLEIYLEVLDKLKTKDISFRSSLALLNLFRTSRINAEIIKSWAAKVEEAHYQTRPQYHKVALICRSFSTLCRRLAGLCIVCNQREKLFPTDENMTGLQLCRACEVMYYTKVSLARMKAAYILTERVPANQSLERLLKDSRCTSYVTKGGVVYYDWADVYRSLVQPFMVTMSPQSTLNFSYTNEDFGIFYPPNQRHSVSSRFRNQIVWDEICALEGLARNVPETLPPYQIEILSLNYFRYLFDPKWRDDISKEQRFAESMKVIKSWSTKEFWDYRPWSTLRIPVRFPALRDEGSLLPSPREFPDLEFRRHLNECRKLGLFVRRDPEILSKPLLWLRDFYPYVGLRTVELPSPVDTSATQNSPAGELSEDFDVELLKYDGAVDVEFVCKREKSIFIWCPPVERPDSDGDIARLDTISFRGGNVFIRTRCLVDGFSYYTKVKFIDGTLSSFEWTPCRCHWCFHHAEDEEN